MITILYLTLNSLPQLYILMKGGLFNTKCNTYQRDNLTKSLLKERAKKAVKSKEQVDLEKARGKEKEMIDEIAK